MSNVEGLTVKPESYKDVFSAIKTIQDRFVDKRSLMDKLIARAKEMPSTSTRVKAGSWESRLGMGTLRIKTPSRSAKVVLVRGDDFNFSRSKLSLGLLYWTDGRYQFLTAVQPIDFETNVWAFYQETLPDILRLEQFGGDELGWWQTKDIGRFLKDIKVGWKNFTVFFPAFVDPSSHEWDTTR